MGFFQTHASDGQLQKFRLYFIGLTPGLYWTDCDIDIEWSGHTWVAQPIIAGAVNNQPTGAVAQYEVGDASGALFAVLAVTGGAEMAPAAIYEAGFLVSNVGPVPDEVLQIFSGRVDRCVASTASRDAVTIVLMPPSQQLSATLPTRLISRLP